MDTVNELSGTIDLESTLIKAEVLFRKFHRVVEAVDKKSNFPAPRRTGSGQWAFPPHGSSSGSAGEDGSVQATTDSSNSNSNSNPASPAPAAGSPTGSSAQGKAKGKSKATEEAVAKVITPELRKLLSRSYDVLPRATVAQKGEGMPAATG